MPTITQSQALVRANQIRTETAAGANTAERVGSLYVDLFDSLLFANAPYSVSTQDLIQALDVGAVARPIVTVDSTGRLVLRGRDASDGVLIGDQTGTPFYADQNGVEVGLPDITTNYIRGLRVRASTVATNSVQVQNSPASVVESEGYDTDGSVSVTVGFGWVSVPIPGTTVTGTMRHVYGLNGTYAPTGIEFDYGGNMYAVSAVFRYDGPNANGVTTHDNFVIESQRAATVGIPRQRSPVGWWRGSAYDTDNSVSRFVRMGLQCRPIEGTTVSGALSMLFAIDGAVSDTGLSFTSSGRIYFGGLAPSGSLDGILNFPYSGGIVSQRDSTVSANADTIFGVGTVSGDPNWLSVGSSNLKTRLSSTIIQLGAAVTGRLYFGPGLDTTASDGMLNIPYGGPFVVGLAQDGITYATLMAWLSISGDPNWLSIGHSSYKTRIGSSTIAIGAVTPNTTPITIRFANTTNGAGALITQDASAFVFRGDSKSTGTDQNGLPAYIDGGRPTGTGRMGSSALRLNPDDVVANGQFLAEAAEVVDGRRVLALLGMTAANTTKLPANTGDGVLHLGRAQTSPTAAPGSGALKWVDPASDNLESWSIGDTNIRYGAFVARFRSSNGNWTNLGGSEIEVRVASSGSATSGFSTRVTGQFLTGSGANSTAGPGEIRGGDNQGTAAAFTFKGGTAMVRAGDASGSGGGGTYVGGDLWLRPGTGATRVGNTMLGASDPTAFNWQSMQRGFCVDMAAAKPTTNPPSTKVWMYVDPNDLRLRIQDESGDLSMTVPIGTPLADANATLVVSSASIRHMPAATMTASRTLVIDDLNAVTNELFEIYRFDETPTFNLVVQNHDTTPLHTIPPGKWKLVLRFNGTDWGVFTLLRLP